MTFTFMPFMAIQWFHLNDAICTAVTWEHVQLQEATLLVYERDDGKGNPMSAYACVEMKCFRSHR